MRITIEQIELGALILSSITGLIGYMRNERKRIQTQAELELKKELRLTKIETTLHTICKKLKVC